MKLSRRGIFGVGAGAAIAGPSMAKEAIARAGNQAGTLAIGGYADGAKTCAPIEDPHWFDRCRADLEKQARGEFGEDDHPYHKAQFPVGDPGLDRLDGLRSVSTPVKRLMANDLASRRAREQRMEYASYELRQLIKNNIRKLF